MPKLHKKSIRYLIICAVGVLILLALGIYPRYQSIVKLDADITDRKHEIETQKILYPVFQTLLEKSKVAEPELLPAPEKGTLDRSKVVMIPDAFREIAILCNLQPIDIAPDLQAMTKDSQFLSVAVHIKGDFFKLRDFLMRLSEVPYVAHIETIQIQPVSEDKEFRLKLWLALDA